MSMSSSNFDISAPSSFRDDQESRQDNEPEAILFEGASHIDFWMLGAIWLFFKFVLACKLWFGTPIYHGFPTLMLMLCETVIFAFIVALVPRQLTVTTKVAHCDNTLQTSLLLRLACCDTGECGGI